MKKLPELIKYLRPAKQDGENSRPPAKTREDASAPQVGTRQLVNWLLHLARPVLKPLYLSAVARLLDQAFGIALIAFGVYRIGAAVVAITGGTALSSAYLWVSVGVMAVLALLKAVFRYLEQFAGHYVAFKALEILRQEMFRSLVPQSPACMVGAKSGDLLTRITADIDRIEVFFAHTLVPAFSAVVIPLAVSILAGFLVSPLSGVLLFLVYLVTLLSLMLLGGGESKQAADALGKAKGQVAQSVTDSVNGISEVTGYGLQRARTTQLERYMSIVGACARPLTSLQALRRALTQSGMYLAALAVIWVGMPSPGDLAVIPAALAATFAVMRSWEVCRGVEDFSTHLDNAFAAARRVWQVANSAPQVATGGKNPPAQPFPIIFEDVSFTYPQSGQRISSGEALQDVSFTIPAGSWTAICGATGSGKSTLARLLLRYWDVDSGQILLGDSPLPQLDPQAIRRAIPLVTQRIHIFSASIADNLRLGKPDASEEQLWQVLKVVELDQVVTALPAGLNTRVGRYGGALSGGQRQRLSLARALLNDSPVLVLDEFTAHLESALAARIRHRVREKRPQATIIEITHTLRQVEEADQVLVLSGGKLAEQGDPEHLLAQAGELAKLYAHEKEAAFTL
ncbi:MAG: thiol reductant ABC exporter subunit CydC [Varibaculum cambriense]|uniref:thiol reductant ABC exporter subunit CydC n=1 Tax=Varibaculum cambriense TaxID=184870 RepID=UPI00241D92A0|nr:thiol reductant ABC exporter subunit CydC [Varibaculum cambriense]MBS6753363.1 thiol reductant ABC exporter subunit CydC [Varibaculum cambriense]